MKLLSARAFCLSWLLAGTFATHAATRTWVGGVPAYETRDFNHWSLAANWSPAGPPQDGDTLVFPDDEHFSSTENDLFGLVLERVIIRGETDLEGNAFTLSGGLELRSSHGTYPKRVFIENTIEVKQGVAAPFEIIVESTIGEHLALLVSGSRDVLVRGGDADDEFSGRIGLKGLLGSGNLRVHADGAHPGAFAVLVGDQLAGFSGEIRVERGEAFMHAMPTPWNGTIRVGTVAGDEAGFSFSSNPLGPDSLIEVFAGATAHWSDAEVGEVRFHGGSLQQGYISESRHEKPLRVRGSLNQLPDAQRVALSGDIVLDHPVLTVAAAGMSLGGTLQTPDNSPTTELVKRGPGVLTLTGTGEARELRGGSAFLQSPVRVEEGTLRLTDSRGLGDPAAGTTVARGATLEFATESVGTFDAGPNIVSEAITLEGGSLTPALVGGERINFAGPITLAGDAVIRAEDFVALSGPILGPGRLRGEAAPDGLLLLRFPGKTYLGETEMLEGNMEVESPEALPGATTDIIRFLVGSPGGGAATLTLPRIAPGQRQVAAEVRTGGTLVMRDGEAQQATYLQSLRLAGQARLDCQTSWLEIGSQILEIAAAPAGLATLTGTVHLPGDHPDTPAEFIVDVKSPDTGLKVIGRFIQDDPGLGGNLIKRGPGQLIMAGSLPSDIYGETRVERGSLVLAKTNGAVALLRDRLRVGPQANDDARLVIQGANQLERAVEVIVGPGGTLELPGPRQKPEAIGSLAGAGVVQVAAGTTLQVGLNSLSTEFRGALVGAGNLVKLGGGSLRLSGTNEHTGFTRVEGGTLLVDGLFKASALTVAEGSTLGGSGMVQAVTVNSGSLLAPGGSAGRLTTGDLLLQSDARLRMELAGNAPGTGFDQLSVNGTVSLAGARLDLVPGFVPELGKTFRLIDNDLADAITGPLVNVAEGARLTNGPVVFAASYAAGNSANDLVLEVVATEGGAANQPPIIGALVSPRTVAEGGLVDFLLNAHDPDAGNTITFSLDAPVPAGVQVNAAGHFTWSPTEAQGPSTNVITVRVTDSAQPPASVTRSFTVIVTEDNSAPQIESMADLTVAEGTELSVKLAASDGDLPAQNLAFAFTGNVPAGATLNVTAGRLRWTPTEAQGPSTNTFTVQVTDDGSPAKSASVSFQVIVTEQNTRPEITAPANATVAEGAAFAATVTAADADAPTQKLTFSLAGTPPTGLTINAQTGALAWTPGEADGGATNVVQVRATDDGSPVRSATGQFTLIVAERNEPPVLSPVSDRDIAADAGLSLRLKASDPDRPEQTLTFAFDGQRPTGMSLESATGRLTWEPTAEQRPSTNVVTVKVTDNGSPAKSDSVSFTVRALTPGETPAPALEIELLADGQLEFAWDSVAGTIYRLQQRADLGTGDWALVESVSATAERTIRRVVPLDEVRFYRLEVP